MQQQYLQWANAGSISADPVPKTKAHHNGVVGNSGTTQSLNYRDQTQWLPAHYRQMQNKIATPTKQNLSRDNIGGKFFSWAINPANTCINTGSLQPADKDKKSYKRKAIHPIESVLRVSEWGRTQTSAIDAALRGSKLAGYAGFLLTGRREWQARLHRSPLWQSSVY